MKFREIIVNGVEYGWRVHKSADKIEIKGPKGLRVWPDACELLGVDYYKMHTEHQAFDRHHGNSPWYVELPVTPKQIAEWIEKHEPELAKEVKHPAKKKKIRFVGKAEAGKGWRVYDRKIRRWWGFAFESYPYALIEELNNEKRSQIINELLRIIPPYGKRKNKIGKS